MNWRDLAGDYSSRKILVCRWGRPTQQHHTSTFACWQVDTFYITRAGCAYLDYIGVTVPGRDWCGQQAAYGLRTPLLPVNADPLDVARAAIQQHGNDFYSRDQPVARVLIEHPTVAGVWTVIDPTAMPESTELPPLADSGRRYSVLATHG